MENTKKFKFTANNIHSIGIDKTSVLWWGGNGGNRGAMVAQFWKGSVLD
jgi:hypothetical protein